MIHFQFFLCLTFSFFNSGLAEALPATTLDSTGTSQQPRHKMIAEDEVADLFVLMDNTSELTSRLDSLIYTADPDQSRSIDTLVSSPEVLVQRQLDAYNARDLAAFLATYADSITIYDFPDQLLMRGKSEVRSRYSVLFEETPNLHAEIKNRIILGNKVIDQEYVRVGERYIEAVAIYEVAGDKIARVTFVRAK